MATYYVRSTDGNNADGGTTWALAKATIVGADGVDAAGDTIYVSQAHSESTAGAVSPTYAGTRASPTRVICANDGAEPPTAVAATAVVASTGTASITISMVNNGALYMEGITFKAGSGNVTANITLNASSQGRAVFVNCEFWIVATGASCRIAPTSAQNASTEWRNCNVKFGATQQMINFNGNGPFFRWIGGSVVSGSSAAATIFLCTSPSGGCVLVEGVDFSNLGSGVNIATPSTNGPNFFTMRNCKMPSSWSGSLVTTTPGSDARYSMYNCSASGQNYRLWIETYAGAIRDETTLVRAGGATDGTTPIAWKMVSSADAEFFIPLMSDEIVRWNETTGSAITATVHILHDSATNLTDEEVWVEVQYLGSSGAPNSTTVTDAKATILTTAADQSSSSETWTTTGMANPNTQKLHVSFTPQMAGFLIARVMLAKPSKTVYVCPKMEIA